MFSAVEMFSPLFVQSAESFSPPSVLPPGVVQHLAVASEVAAGNQMELSIQWGAPVVVYTTGEVEYDVLVQSGSGAWEIWDNRSAVNTYRAKVGMCSIQDACNLSGVYALSMLLYSFSSFLLFCTT